MRDLDDLFRVPGMHALLRDVPAEPEIRIDVTQDEKAYYVKADVPALKKEDIDISINGDQVSITAETRRSADGVLQLTLPKKNAAPARELTVG